nr:hypothetical protein [Tanacetum cinerariifolium]
MQRFWYSINKVKGMDSYEFLLANKKCVVNANVFRIIFDICLRAKGVNFTDVPDDDTTLTFLIKLGYKGPLYKHTNMFVDHMHQPWRTLAAIINKCLFGKISSNDKLRHYQSLPQATQFSLKHQAFVRNKIYKAFPLPVIEFPLPGEVPTASEESSHCQKKRDATAHNIALLLKSTSNYQSKSYDSYAKRITLNPNPLHSQPLHQEMDQQNPTLAKIPILDIRKFEQWQFRIQQYLQHEHYALWEVIEFGDSYEAPANVATTDSASDGTGKEKRKTVTLTTYDIQKRKNDVKVRTTLLLSIPDEHQLRFSKYKTTQELWAVILKTFGGNEATKKTKKNLLKQQYGNFKVEEPNSQNMAFISSAKHNSGNEEVNIASGSTASINVSTASANIRVATISQDTACAYIASQSISSQIKFKDINQIDEDDMEEMDIKWNMALLSMRADRFWKKTGKKISIQGTDMARFDKSKVECFNCHKMGYFARECRAPRSQDRGRRDNYKQGSKVEEQTPKALMAIEGVGWDWSYMENDKENHALIADEEIPTEFALMAKTSVESEVFDNSLCSKACKKNSDSLNNYSRPSPAIESTSDDAQNRNPFEASPSTISPISFIKFVKANDSSTKSKTNKVETAKKPHV